MARPTSRLIALMLPLALAAGSGCVGTPTTSSSIKRRPPSTAVKSPVPSAAASATNLKGATPRPAPPSVSPAPSPAASPAASPTAAPSRAPVMAQPVAINQGSDGFSTSTRNYLVVSVATGSPAPSYQMAVGDGALGVASVKESYKTLSSGPRDSHAAFRAFEQAQMAGLPLPKPPAYKLQQTVPTLLEGVEKKFWVITSFDRNAYKDVQITAKLAKVGRHCYVFVDKKIDESATAAATMAKRAAEIQATFDNQIYPTNVKLFGSEPNPGVDGDPHVVLLISPAVGNYGADTTLGYFSQRDEYLPSPDLPPIFQHSNGREMLYISSRIVLTGSDEDYMGTVAHEFQHMINYNQKVLVGRNQQSDDLWIDEGMAMYAIEANGYGLKTGGRVLADHVKRYQQEPGDFSLVDWDNNPDGIGYGPVYLFMVYLADRFSESIIKDIVTAKGLGIPNIEAKLKERKTDFKTVFHDWAMANFLDGRTTGVSEAHKYQSLDMTGLSGRTRLDGVSASALRLPSNHTWNLRPYTASYFEMPQGQLTPRFTFTPNGTTSVEPRLVLP
jgi:hypothetical protein